MKKSLGMLGFVALSFALVQPSYAQLFQNDNTDCEEIPVVSPSTGFAGISVACKYYNGNVSNFSYSGADFDGNTYADCVIGSATTAIQPSVVPQASVLLNLGTGATACTSGSGGDQFDTAENYNLTGLTPIAKSLGLASTVAGPIIESYTASPTPNSDFAIPLVQASTSGDLVIAPNIGGSGTFDPSPVSSTDISYQVSGNDLAFTSDVTDKSVALLDCDADGDLDSAIAVANTGEDFFAVNLLVNDGASSATAVQELTDIPFTSGSASLSVGDFNNDGNDDVVLATNDGVDSFVQVCTNDGACVLTCDTANKVDVATLLGSNPAPASIAAGDFNGDGNVDAAITTPGLLAADQGMLLLFGAGNATLPTTLSVNYAPAGVTVGGEPVTLAVGCFDNDNTEDLAMTFSSLQFSNDARVGVFTDVSTTSVDTTTLTFNAANVDFANGIDTADFDQLGGDDILMVASDQAQTANLRQGFVFMNTVENIVANAGSDVTIENAEGGDIEEGGSSVALSGTCTMDPEDEAASFAVIWTLTSPTTGAVISDSTTLTPTFTATEDGVYTVTLSCRTRCDNIVTDTVVITVGNGILEGSGVFWSSCSFNPLASFSGMGMASMFSSLVLLLAVRRRK